MNNKYAVMGLIASYLVAISSWGMQHYYHGHVEWSELLEPHHIFSLLGVIGSVYGGWYSGKKSEIKPTED